MHKLSGETVRLISSAQVITSIGSVVKELIENSLDAHANNIEIKLFVTGNKLSGVRPSGHQTKWVKPNWELDKMENFGIDKVEVRDNGYGIQAEDAEFMGRRHYTSKLSIHDDLENLITYGFRGEALGSLCAVSNVAIATKTKDEEVGRCYTLDHEGFASSPKPSQCCTGTTVTALRLFHNVPVRKQYYSNAKRRREELKKVEDLLLGFGVVCPGVRFSLSHNKTSIWQKNKLPNMKAALLNTLGSNVMGQLVRVERSDEETQVKMEGYLPKPGSDDQLTTRSTDDRTWISVNGRPVTMKDISKVVKQYYTQAHPKAGNVRHVVMCLAITMPTYLVDVNLEPNKTKVLLQNNDAVLCLIIQMLEELYNITPTVESSQPTVPDQSQIQPLPAPSTDTSTVTTCELDLKQPNEQSDQSRIASHNTTEFLEHIASTELDGSQGISMICEILTNSASEVSEVPENQVCGNKTEENTMKTAPNPVSFFEEDGESMFKNCLQSTQSIPPESSRAQVSVVDILDGSLANTDFGGVLGNDTGNKIQKEDQVSNSNQGILDAGVVDGGDVAKELDEALWSKGHGLVEPSGKTVQPSVLLIPGRQESAPREPKQATTSTESSYQVPLPCKIRPLQESNEASVTSIKVSTTHIATASNQSSTNLPAPLPCVIQPLHEAIDGSISSSRLPQVSGNSLLFTTSVTNIQNQNTSVMSSGGQPSPCNSQGKGNEKTGIISSEGPSSCTSPVRMKRPVEEMSSPASQYDLVGKAPVKRPQDAFTFFFKEKKPEILRQHPTLDFMSINKIIKRQWEELDEEEMVKYEELEAKDLQRYKDQVVCAKQSLTNKEPKNGLPAKKKKKVEKLSNQSLIDEMLASQRERKLQEALTEEEDKRLETIIPFSVAKLREVQHVEGRSNSDEWRLIGSLPDHGVWMAICGRHLSVLNQYRAQEVVLYHRLLAMHKLPYQKLPVPIELSAGMFGDQKNWYTLLGMKSQVNPIDQSRLFIDERLLLNGFEIRQLIDPDTMDAKLEVISMSMKIVPFYGIDDLVEIVETIATQRVQSVMQCRPLKLANHLMGEAVRMARSLPNIMSAEEVRDIMEGVERLTMWKSKLCLHGKSFVKDIYTIPDVDTDEMDSSFS